MRLTPSDAANLFGIHRATLYRHMASGRLSWVLEPNGSRALDMSELIRCYGEPPGNATPDATDATTSASEDATPATVRLLTELVELTRRQSEELHRLREEVAALRRLPPPPDQGDTPQAADEADNWSSFSDLPAADAEFLQERPVVTGDEGRTLPSDDHDPHGLRSLARSLYQDES